MKLAIRGMMPRNIVTKDSLTRLHIYRGAEHQQTAQKPEPWAFNLSLIHIFCQHHHIVLPGLIADTLEQDHISVPEGGLHRACLLYTSSFSRPAFSAAANSAAATSNTLPRTSWAA